jgi:FKBP-type peptidyl-prolyl cis-trans isomerase
MRNGIKIILFSTLFVLFTGGVIGFGIWKSTTMSTNKQVVATTASTPQASATGTLNVTGNSGLGGGTEVSMSGGNDQNNKQSKASSVPGPESFGQYEQYKDSKTVMYSDLKVGDGAELAVGKKAAVIYKVWLTNGTLVDETRLDKPGGKLQALSFTLGDHSLIPGWEQGVLGMKVNGLRRLIIPASLAYGAQGKDPVPPNAMLIIDIQLMQVE